MENGKNELQVVENDFLEMMPIGQAESWYNGFKTFVKSILKSDLDYGIIPGTPKPTLYKAGAEKLRFVYGIGIETEVTDKTIDFDKPFVSYTYKCTAKSKTGQILAQSEGNCNSMEPKFAYVWKSANELPAGVDLTKLVSKSSGKKMFEFDFAINKSETSGQYGKPETYWNEWKAAIKSGKAKKTTKKTKAGKEMDGYEMGEAIVLYRVNNPDVVGLQNTIMKMGIKRAFVAAILMATGASEFFTQDIEDMDISGTGVIYSDDTKGHDYLDAEVLFDENPKIDIPESWKKKAAACIKPEDIDSLIQKNATTVNAHPALAQFLADRKKELESQSIVEGPANHLGETLPDNQKKPISDVQFKNAMQRVVAGELDVYYKSLDLFSLTENQAITFKEVYDQSKKAKKKEPVK